LARKSEAILRAIFPPFAPLIRSEVFERIGIGDWDRLGSQSQSPACDQQAGEIPFREKGRGNDYIPNHCLSRDPSYHGFGDSPPNAEIADTRDRYSNRP